MMKFQDEDLDLFVSQYLEGHAGTVRNLAWKPSAGVRDLPAVLASCSEDNTVRIWGKNPSTDEFQCKGILRGAHKMGIVSVAWSPCGKLLATASLDATASIWKEIGDVFSHVHTLVGHRGAVNSVSWNQSSTFVATCGLDKRILIWNIRVFDNKCNCIAILEEHTEEVKMVLWHPLLNHLFSCSCDNTIKVWAPVGLAWECIQTLNESVSGHSSVVWALSFNNGGDMMVSCSDDLTIKIWNCDMDDITEHGDGIRRPWTHLCTLSGDHDRTIFSVHWSSEGIISTGAADGAICCFGENGVDYVNEDDSFDDEPYVSLMKMEKAHDMHVNVVHWTEWISMDNRLLASAGDEDGTITIWKLQ